MSPAPRRVDIWRIGDAERARIFAEGYEVGFRDCQDRLKTQHAPRGYEGIAVGPGRLPINSPRKAI